MFWWSRVAENLGLAEKEIAELGPAGEFRQKLLEHDFLLEAAHPDLLADIDGAHASLGQIPLNAVFSRGDLCHHFTNSKLTRPRTQRHRNRDGIQLGPVAEPAPQRRGGGAQGPGRSRGGAPAGRGGTAAPGFRGRTGAPCIWNKKRNAVRPHPLRQSSPTASFANAIGSAWPRQLARAAGKAAQHRQGPLALAQAAEDAATARVRQAKQERQALEKLKARQEADQHKHDRAPRRRRCWRLDPRFTSTTQAARVGAESRDRRSRGPPQSDRLPLSRDCGLLLGGVDQPELSATVGSSP